MLTLGGSARVGVGLVLVACGSLVTVGAPTDGGVGAAPDAPCAIVSATKVYWASSFDLDPTCVGAARVLDGGGDELRALLARCAGDAATRDRLGLLRGPVAVFPTGGVWCAPRGVSAEVATVRSATVCGASLALQVDARRAPGCDYAWSGVALVVLPAPTSAALRVTVTGTLAR